MQGVGNLQAGQVDDFLHESGQAGRLDLDALGEPLDTLRVVLGVEDRLGKQTDASHRSLELVAHIGHEVTSDLLDPTRARPIVREDKDERLAERGHARAHVDLGGAGPLGQLELGLANLAVAADLTGEIPQLGVDEIPLSDQPVRDGRRAGRDNGVRAVEHDADGLQDGEDIPDATWQRRLIHIGDLG